MTIRGIDVSKWQGTINWDALKGDVDFVFMKATQGTNEVDSQFVKNRKAARASGIPHAFYHYPNGGNVQAEADFFLKTCARQNGEGQSLDFEGSILNIGNPVKWCLDWDNYVYNKTKNRPIDYMSASVIGRFDFSAVVKANYGLWEAAWQNSAPNPGEWPFWAFWQTSDNGHVAGISGNVDTDDFNGTLAQLKAYFANVGTVTPVTPPKPVKPAPPIKKPTPTPHPAPVHPVPSSTYTVRSGDNMTNIAKKFGISLASLIKLNPQIKNPNEIYVGNVLHVAGTPVKTAPSGSVTVKSGDSLSSIAAAHKLTLAQIEAKNPSIKNPNLIFPGEHVNV